MKVERKEAGFSPVTITLENEKELRCLFWLTGDQLYHCLQKQYGFNKAGDICDFKGNLHDRLADYDQE